MRTIQYYLSVLVVLSVLLSSCSKEDNALVGDTAEDVATLTFGAVLNDMMKKSALKQAEGLPGCSEDDPSYAAVTLTYGDTEIDVEVDILLDDNGYFTAYHDNLEIPVTSGNTVTLNLTDFRVFDADNVLLWVAPKENSDFEDFVDDALPMEIELRAGTKNYVDVEVLCFDDRVVNRYGYQFFDLLPETVYELCMFTNYCTDSGRHYTADYSLDLYYYRGDDEEGEPILDDLIINESPAQQGTAGNWFTDPLCVAVPTPQRGEDADDPYLYYEVTLEEWDDNYTYPGALVQTGYLSWNDIAGFLDTDDDDEIDDNSDVDYLHLQINCEDGGNGEPIDPDRDDDGIININDDCPNLAGTAEFDGCPDYDNDGVPYPEDNCPDTASGVEVYTDGELAGCSIENGSLELPVLDGGCEHAFMLETTDDDGFYTGGDWGWAEYISAEDSGFPIIYELTTVDGEDIGDVTIEIDGNDVSVNTQLLLDSGVYLDELNIHVSSTAPEAVLPENYEYNFEVGDISYNETVENIEIDNDGGFWIIIHAEVCPTMQ